jgi:uncharacterized protein (TIGR02145 family)
LLGRHLKSKRTAPENHPRWNEPNTDATNKTGFSGLPGGYVIPSGSRLEVGERGFWWSSTDHNGELAWIKVLNYNNSIFNKSDEGYKTFMFSVRCITDNK